MPANIRIGAPQPASNLLGRPIQLKLPCDDGLPATMLTQGATSGLIVRSSEGGLCKARNPCLGALLEAVRARTKVIELKQVNRVLLQPNWRKEVDLPH